MNTLVVDIDSLRADHVGFYGYEAPTTPHIDSLARDGTWFENAYVANSPCLPARAGFISGRYGLNNGVVTHGKSGQMLRSHSTRRHWLANWAEDWTATTRTANRETVGESYDWQTLPELFFHRRVRTCGVSSFPRHTAPWFYHLWHEFHQPQEPAGDEEFFQTPRAEAVVDTGLDFLESHGDEEFFLYVQLWDPHVPYKRPEGDVARFRNPPLPPHPTDEQIRAHRESEWSFAAALGVESRDDLGEMVAQYDAEIRYADRQIGRLLARLRDLELYDDTLVVVLGDHGEEFGENGVYRQHWSVHEGTQRIPLVFKPPTPDDGTPAGPITPLVTNVDIPPTLADYAGFETPASWQGRSLRPLVAGTDSGWRDHVVLEHGLYTVQRAIRTPEWKFVRTYHPAMWEAFEPKGQLYRLSDDPWEQQDLSEARPEVAASLERRMDAWVDRHEGPEGDALAALARRGPPSVHVDRQYWSAGEEYDGFEES
jgi:arylsulfatase A-like enzyme